MLVYKKTSALAVRHVFDPQVMGTLTEAVVKESARAFGNMTKEAAAKILGDWVKTVAEKVRSHFTDHSERLTEALARSNEKAWKTIEIALGGQRLWDRFASAEDQALRDQVKTFVESKTFLESAVAADDPNFLTACLKELRQARAKGHFRAGDDFRAESLAEEVGSFVRFDDPEALLEAECAVVVEVAGEFQRLGYRHLCRLLAVKPTRGQPLLAMAAQYYFRRAVGEDPVLARELEWVRMSSIDRRVEEGFAFLALIQERHGQTLEEALEGLARVEIIVIETRDAVLDLHADVRGLSDQLKLVRRELTPGHSVSYRDEHERALIEEVKRRYRTLSDDQRRRFPQLGLDLSRLEIVAGDFREALDEARRAAHNLDDPTSKAEAHHAAYRAALELKSWDEALAELLQAVEADSRFAIWPVTKYRVERILGAGAFGVALLCHHRYLKDRHVVIKTVEPAGIDRDVAKIFSEAHILEHLEHPGIVRLLDCGFADEAREQRPYLELAQFTDSLTLEKYVHEYGGLAPDDLLPVAVQTAQALKAANEAGVLHRDVKPSNLLVRKTARGWEVKVIDFGLSLRRSLVQTSQARAASLGRSMVGSAVAGTLHYAAPEQLDPDRSREVGPHSDVFGFGRTCYFALFHEPYPDQEDLETLPQPWKDLLGRCTAKKIDRRPKDFAAVLERLKTIRESSPEVVTSLPGTTLPGGPAESSAEDLSHTPPLEGASPAPASSDSPAPATLSIDQSTADLTKTETMRRDSEGMQVGETPPSEAINSSVEATAALIGKPELVEHGGEITRQTASPGRDRSTSSPDSESAGPDPGNLKHWERSVGLEMLFRITGRTTGVVYGSDVYTSDSNLATAAVHAGVLAPGQTDVVRVRIVPVLPRYEGSTRNGVTTRPWTSSWTGAFRVERASASWPSRENQIRAEEQTQGPAVREEADQPGEVVSAEGQAETVSDPQTSPLPSKAMNRVDEYAKESGFGCLWCLIFLAGCYGAYETLRQLFTKGVEGVDRSNLIFVSVIFLYLFGIMWFLRTSSKKWKTDRASYVRKVFGVLVFGVVLPALFVFNRGTLLANYGFEPDEDWLEWTIGLIMSCYLLFIPLNYCFLLRASRNAGPDGSVNGQGCLSGVLSVVSVATLLWAGHQMPWLGFTRQPGILTVSERLSRRGEGAPVYDKALWKRYGTSRRGMPDWLTDEAFLRNALFGLHSRKSVTAGLHKNKQWTDDNQKMYDDFATEFKYRYGKEFTLENHEAVSQAVIGKNQSQLLSDLRDRGQDPFPPAEAPTKGFR
jgi:serine/threonine protein kinase